MRSFCEQLKELRKEHDFVWFADAHVNIVIKYPEIVIMMVDAGLVRMQIGIESCNQHIIDIYNKKIKREGLFEVIEICQAAGLPQLVGNLIIGGALETRESLDDIFDTVNQMIKAGCGMVEVVSTFYMPFPETAMSKNPQAFGIYVKDEELIAEYVLHAQLGKNDEEAVVHCTFELWLYTDVSGEIRIEGIDIKGIPAELRVNTMSSVDQEIVMYSASVLDNITMWDETIAVEEVIQATKDACIYEDILALPNAFDHILNEGGKNLSGDQRPGHGHRSWGQ